MRAAGRRHCVSSKMAFVDRACLTVAVKSLEAWMKTKITLCFLFLTLHGWARTLVRAWVDKIVDGSIALIALGLWPLDSFGLFPTKATRHMAHIISPCFLDRGASSTAPNRTRSLGHRPRERMFAGKWWRVAVSTYVKICNKGQQSKSRSRPEFDCMRWK